MEKRREATLEAVQPKRRALPSVGPYEQADSLQARREEACDQRERRHLVACLCSRIELN